MAERITKEQIARMVGEVINDQTDIPLIRMSINDTLDMLEKEGSMTRKQSDMLSQDRMIKMVKERNNQEETKMTRENVDKIKEMLSPRFDTRKSFYGKAKVKMVNGKKVLQSYQTDVAEIQGGKAFVKGTYSPTTLRHIKEFLKQSGFKADTSKQILKDYGKPIQTATAQPKTNGMLKTTVAVARMGDIFSKTTKESNAWKKRMLKAGLGNQGLSFPKDFDKLSEKEKKKRLNKVINMIK